MIPLLLGLGVEELSVTPGAIGHVCEVLSGLDPRRCESLGVHTSQSRSLSEVRILLAAEGT